MKIAEVIAQGTKEMISESLFRLNIPHKKTMKKAELVSLLEGAALNPKNFERMLAAADEEAIGVLDEAAEGISTVGNPISMVDLGVMGYIYVAEKGFRLSDDAIELYRSIRWSESFLAYRNVMWPLSYFIACFISLYGVIEAETAFELYAKYTGRKLSAEQKELYLNTCYLRRIAYGYSDGYFVHFSLIEDGVWRNLLDLQGDVPFYEPPLWMVTEYADDWYVDRSLAYYELADFIKRYYRDEREYTEIMSDIAFAVQDENSISEILELTDYSLSIVKDKQERRRLKLLLENYIDNARLWSNRGYTNNELERLFSPDGTPKDDGKASKPEASGKILKFGTKK